MDERVAPRANRLASQSSPYLRQHAHNPVDWYPWGVEALERAQREHKPILLSIGYAACHWCHVMAHESFDDAATAAVMNELYVNIKVDREQRPDLDRLYQLSHQMLTGRGGGWPLTMFLMHEDQRPFFGGTYFPGDARFGLPAFRDLLQQVADYYRAHLDTLRQSAARVVAALEAATAAAGGPGVPGAMLDAGPLRSCRAHLERSFDAQYGGFGPAPKFPHAPGVARLLRDWRAGATRDAPALRMVELTLRRMAEGGLFDQLGGGFFRYSVDERWEIPHFEKMLYDNAQLLAVYAETAAATGERLFTDTACATADWMLRELGNGEGGLYSSLDADSEGHEGRYYLWRPEEAHAALAPDQWPVFAARFGLDGVPNFEGQWHLRVSAGIEHIAEAQRLRSDQVRTALAGARATLLRVRAARVRPGLDDKVLCSWNALAVTALSVAARCLGREDYAAAATAALHFLRRVHWREGRLLASSSGGSAQFRAYLDDYAFLLEAILELQSVRFRVEELQWAIELADVLLRHFEDGRAGGFFFTADDHEALISRPKSFTDEAIPAGNAVAARALLRLGYLLGESRYLLAAERTLRAAWPGLQQYPEAHATLLQGLEDALDPPQIVLLRGRSAAIAPWHRELNAVFAPRRWTLAVPSDLDGLPAAIAAKVPGAGPLAYVCRGSVCGAPASSLTALLREL
ncbi:MAG TPA: thioredoxin domain-containing protein [Steroidobacteraceae bacterium]